MSPPGSSQISLGPLCFSERPLRREPGTAPPDSDIYRSTPDERAATVRAALDAGITVFHAAHEREAASLGASLRTLGVRERVTVSTTDGDALDRCPDTAEGAAQAIAGAIARKRQLLGVDVLDLFSLYDCRPETHTRARLVGATRALENARVAGQIRHIGATCYGAYDALAEAVDGGVIPLDVVIARYNYLEQGAARRLLPACRERGIIVLAAQTFAWTGGVPFVRFPNTWRYRNLTKNFYGFTAAQAHLHWVLEQDAINGALVSMQTPAQIQENLAAAKITKTPQGLETLFQSFVEAITTTREGWRGMLQDEEWEYRTAAEAFLGRKG